MSAVDQAANRPDATPDARAKTGVRPPPEHREIAARAEAIWRGMGSPHACDVAIWLEAEQQLVRPVPEKKRKTGVAGRRFDSGKIMDSLDAQFPGTAGPATTSL